VSGETAKQLRPSASVVIPAHNEAAVIESCLRALLPDSNGIEILVVCNGCTDDTADRARACGPGVRVLETTEASKAAAMNLGAEHACGEVLVFQDADVFMTSTDVRALASQIANSGALAAAPSVKMVLLPGTSWAVRAYYRFWMALPYVKEGMMAAGVCALGPQGRARVGRFPRVVSDDGYLRLHFRADERAEVASAVSRVMAPKRFADLVKIKTRSRLGWYELRAKHSDLFKGEIGERSYARALLLTMANPCRWSDAAPYVLVNILSRIRAKRQLQKLSGYVWERDESTRQAAVPSSRAI
jgi:glycosyltransferase involved in cell wall biosynthesis